MSVALSEYLPLLTTAPLGIHKLRGLILDLAMRGMLVGQDTKDEPASELFARIEQERMRLEAEGIYRRTKPMPDLTPEDMPYDLPPSWTWVRLGEITNFGQTDKSGELTESTWVLDLEDIEKETSVLFKKIRHSERQAKSDKNRFKSGDVLYGKLRPYLNKVIVADEPGVCTTEILPIRGFCGVMPRFLMYALKRPDFLAYVNAKSYGMKMPRLGTEDGRLAVFPLAPEAEQRRIATKLDELMELCDRLNAEQTDAEAAHAELVKILLGSLIESTDIADLAKNWQRIAEAFEEIFATESSIVDLEQTILQLAIRGKLVPQDPNDEPASELLLRITQERAGTSGGIKKMRPLAPIDEVDAPFHLPSGWAWARFPELGEFGRGKSKHRPRNDPVLFNPGIYPLVQTGEVARAGTIVQEYHSKYSELGLHQSKMWPQGTLCITIAANIADSAILGFDACFPDSVVGFVPSSWISDSRYFLFFMKTARAELLRFAPSTAQKNINLEILEAVRIPLPPQAEMKRIVAKVDELMALCDRLKADILESRRHQERLATALIESALKAA